ncbi:hypothetical protein M8C21_011256 [Ambrosia artemisiifolia]|uniref:Gnk2-homologous domain-containing protein n=1 Tax=Ambrosia artemisiifolia TaxID=4212 RepID=A0AAD5D0X3_AMBAR|nr:hypothetical protein M8C21_011256 [Ambrosia artemisiifolia]
MTPECAQCVKYAVSQVGVACPYSYSGKLDTSLRFKKCSKSVSHDVQLVKHRDDVLVELGEADQGFRVRSSGLVQGFSQCLGDLNQGDCSTCLEEAISKLKSLCGTSEAGDVFLAQCYMKYWTAGYYDPPSRSPNDDDVGKTIAIIVGVVGGVAAFIVIKMTSVAGGV